MEYDFDIERIPGTENEVADCLSRLLILNRLCVKKRYRKEPPLTVPPATALALLAIPEDGKLSPFKIPRDAYKKIAACHNSGQGHFGVELTLKKLKDRFKKEGRWPPPLRQTLIALISKDGAKT